MTDDRLQMTVRVENQRDVYKRQSLEGSNVVGRFFLLGIRGFRVPLEGEDVKDVVGRGCGSSRACEAGGEERGGSSECTVAHQASASDSGHVDLQTFRMA